MPAQTLFILFVDRLVDNCCDLGKMKVYHRQRLAPRTGLFSCLGLLANHRQ